MVSAIEHADTSIVLQVHDKEKEVRELLECSEQDLKDHFHEFIDIGNRITDWGAEDEAGAVEDDDEMGVAVDFDDDADEEDAGNGACLQPGLLSTYDHMQRQGRSPVCASDC